MTSLVGLVLCSFSMTGVILASWGERGVLRKVLHDYDLNERPSEHFTQPVNVTMELTLQQVIDLDERSQILTTSVWSRQNWYDYRLRWNTSDHNDTNEIRVFGSRIWRPDMTLYDDVAEQHQDRAHAYVAKVYHNGLVNWNVPVILRSYCRVNVRYFPFDRQSCRLKFGSWSYDSSQLDITNATESADTSVFMDNGEWDLLQVPARRHEVFYNCCNTTYPDITFWIVLQRRPMYYIFNLILPCIFITATTILVFYLPPESGEKVSLSVTVLLASTVFLLLVAEATPPQSEVIPLIGQYFGAVIMLMAVSTALTVVVIHLHHRGSFGTPVPPWMRSVILHGLASVMCLRSLVRENLSDYKIEKRKSKQFRYIEGGAQNGLDESTFHNLGTSLNNQQVTPPSDKATNGSRTEALLHGIYQILRDREKERESEKKLENVRNDWLLVAMVIDRFLLVMFTVVTVVVSSVLLCVRPYEELILED